MWIKDEKPRLWFRMWQDGDGDLTRDVHRETEVCTEPVECSRCRKEIPMGTEMHWQFPARNQWGEIRAWCQGNRVLLRCGLCQYELDLEEKLKPKALQDLMPWELPAYLLAREGEDRDSTVKRIAALRRDLAEIDDEATPGEAERARRGNQPSWPEPTAEGVCVPERGRSEGEHANPLDRGVPEGSKRCRSCDAVKTFDEFTVDNAQQDGHYTSCRKCKNDQRKVGGERKKRTAKPVKLKRAAVTDASKKAIPDSGVPEGSKWCRRCGAVKLSGEFSVDASQPDGLYPACRECKNSRRKELTQERRTVVVERRIAAANARERRAAEKATKALSE